jgi:AraC-like DNA-binding protein
MIICSLLLSIRGTGSIAGYAHIGNQIVFLVGPLLYFYIRYKLMPGFSLNRKDMIHTLPYLLVVSYLIIKFYYIHIPITCRFNHIIIGSFAFVQSYVYFHASVRLLNRRGIPVSKLLRTIPQQNHLAWLALLVIGCFLIWLTKLLFFILWDVSAYYQGCTESINLFFLVSFLFFNTLLYLLLIRPHFFNGNEKYRYSGLNDNEKNYYRKKLISHMNDSKAYRNSLLSLKKLARQIEVPERQLSQIINETMNMSYYEFLNWYRIKECTKYLSDKEYAHKNILSIAYEAGFNSKSVFNSAFKKYTGITPKEFRKNYRTSLSDKIYHSR